MRSTEPGPPPAATTSYAAPIAHPRFTWPVRIYYEDTDAGGVVYYANYLRFFERCRTEWMRELGFGQSALAAQAGVIFVVASAELRYLRPARLDDELLIDACVVERYASYVVFEQQAWRGEQLLCRGKFKVACVDAQTLRPTRLPETLNKGLPAVNPILPASPA